MHQLVTEGIELLRAVQSEQSHPAFLLSYSEELISCRTEVPIRNTADPRSHSTPKHLIFNNYFKCYSTVD